MNIVSISQVISEKRIMWVEVISKIILGAPFFSLNCVVSNRSKPIQSDPVITPALEAAFENEIRVMVEDFGINLIIQFSFSIIHDGMFTQEILNVLHLSRVKVIIIQWKVQSGVINAIDLRLVIAFLSIHLVLMGDLLCSHVGHQDPVIRLVLIIYIPD